MSKSEKKAAEIYRKFTQTIQLFTLSLTRDWTGSLSIAMHGELACVGISVKAFSTANSWASQIETLVSVTCIVCCASA